MNPFAKPPTISDDYRTANFYREAADVLYELGFESASMADIAEAVDLTQGGLYYYIKGKAALLYAIMSYGLDLLETEVLGPARRLEEPAECLRTLIGGRLQLSEENESIMALLASGEEHLEPRHHSKIVARKRVFGELLRDVFAALKIGQNDAETTDPGETAANALTMIHASPTWRGVATCSRDEQVGHIIRRAEEGFATVDPAALGA